MIKPIPIYQRKTIGCFISKVLPCIGLLRRLKCDNYKTLVAASSIRPVAKSGMMEEYILDTIIPINLNISIKF
jgi:hypothetical protein